MSRTLVEVGPIRDAVEEYVNKHHLTWSDLARELGWMTHHRRYRQPVPDVSRIRRRLGFTAQTGKGCMGKSYSSLSQRMTADTATLLVLHIGKDPVDFGF